MLLSFSGGVNASALSEGVKYCCKKCAKIAFCYDSVNQLLTPFLPSYFDKNLLLPPNFCIFASAIEGNALCA